MEKLTWAIKYGFRVRITNRIHADRKDRMDPLYFYKTTSDESFHEQRTAVPDDFPMFFADTLPVFSTSLIGRNEFYHRLFLHFLYSQFNRQSR